MKKVGKWALIVLAGILGVVVIVLIGFFIWLNYDPTKTSAQQDSFDILKNLGSVKPPQNVATMEEPMATVEDDFYGDDADENPEELDEEEESNRKK